MRGGAKVWYFPDGYLPEKVGPGPEAHEALMMMNTGDTPADVKLDFYFEDTDPVKDVAITVGAERVISLHMDVPADIGGVTIPLLTQYAVRVRSSVPIVAMFGRLDTTQPNLAYFTVQGYAE